MALKTVCTPAEHAALSAVLQAEYKKQEDGNFIIDAIPVGGFTLENTEALRAALQTERAEQKELRTRLAAIPEGLDIQAAVAAVGRVKEMENWSPGDKVQKQLEDRTRQIEEKYTPVLSAKDQEIQSLTKEVHRLLVTTAATNAIVKHGGIPELLLPAVERQVRVGKDSKGGFTTTVINAEGNEVVSRRSGHSGPMTIEELVETFKQSPTLSRAFDATVLPGGGTNPSATNPGAGRNGSVQTISEAEARDTGRYRAAKAEAEKAGRQLEIAPAPRN